MIGENLDCFDETFILTPISAMIIFEIEIVNRECTQRVVLIIGERLSDSKLMIGTK